MSSSVGRPDPQPKPEEMPPQEMFSRPKHVVTLFAIVCATKLITHPPFPAFGPFASSGFSSDFKRTIGGNLNPNSLQVIKGAKIEGDVASAKAGDVFQFMRQGYFAIDTDSTRDNIIINRTVALKDSFKK